MLIAPIYVIDTCSLTKMRHTYPEDVFPKAWEKLNELVSSGTLISAEDVYEELCAFDDEIFQWAAKNNEIFHPLDYDVQREAIKLLEKYPTLLDLKKNKSSGDPFIIATAKLYNCILVTEEKPSNSPSRVKIPDVCQEIGIECISLIEMFRREDLKN